MGIGICRRSRSPADGDQRLHHPQPCANRASILTSTNSSATTRSAPSPAHPRPCQSCHLPRRALVRDARLPSTRLSGTPCNPACLGLTSSAAQRPLRRPPASNSLQRLRESTAAAVLCTRRSSQITRAEKGGPVCLRSLIRDAPPRLFSLQSRYCAARTCAAASAPMGI
jgi:hypothetical protein